VVVGFTITEVGEEVEDVQLDFSVVLELVVLLVSQSVDENTRDVSVVMGVITVVASVMTGSSG
jgi:predicted branched-subunit amino acid permease